MMKEQIDKELQRL
jgi:N-acetylneuraminic acid mutarotase